MIELEVKEKEEEEDGKERKGIGKEDERGIKCKVEEDWRGWRRRREESEWRRNSEAVGRRERG